jgi:hypothetical protein
MNMMVEPNQKTEWDLRRLVAVQARHAIGIVDIAEAIHELATRVIQAVRHELPLDPEYLDDMAHQLDEIATELAGGRRDIEGSMAQCIYPLAN